MPSPTGGGGANAVLRDRLLEYCVNNAINLRGSDLPDREGLDAGLLAAHSTIAGVSDEQDPASYAEAVREALYRTWIGRLTVRDDLHSAATSLHAVLQHFAEALYDVDLMRDDFTNLIRGLLPLAVKAHAAGSRSPVAASIDSEGQVYIEGVSPEGEPRPLASQPGPALVSLRRGLENDLAENRRRSFLLFSHGRTPGGYDALIGWLRNATGAQRQVVIAYHSDGEFPEYLEPYFNDDEPPPLGDTVAQDVRLLFIAAADRRYAEWLGDDDPSSDHAMARETIEAVTRSIEEIDTGKALDEYLYEARHRFDAMSLGRAMRDADDPRHIRPRAVQILRYELDMIAVALFHLIPAESRKDFMPEAIGAAFDFAELLEKQMPVVRQYNADGGVDMVFGWLDADGVSSSQEMPAAAVQATLARADQGFADGSMRVTGMFRQVRLDDAGRHQPSDPRDTNMLVAILSHPAGRMLEALIYLDFDEHGAWLFRAGSFIDRSNTEAPRE